MTDILTLFQTEINLPLYMMILIIWAGMLISVLIQKRRRRQAINHIYELHENYWPSQPLVKDSSGVVRFKENPIVTYLLDNGGLDMNDLARQDFSDESRRQFAQLIGYSLDGYETLSYVQREI